MTNAARLRKIRQAHAAAAKAAALLAEVYEPNRDSVYRLTLVERDAHYAVGRSADLADRLVASLAEHGE